MHAPGCNAILCRYGELALKGMNRGRFEARLGENLRRLLRGIAGVEARRVQGRMWLAKRDGVAFTPGELDLAAEVLPRAFGLTSFSPGWMVPPRLDEIRAAVAAATPSALAPLCAAHAPDVPVRVRVRTSRAWKQFPLDSLAMNVALAETVFALPGAERLTVDLENAELTVGCEIREEFAFVHFASLPGPGGLPVGSHPPVLALLSGGIDSPVAALLAMKRGCPVDFITFHSAPYTPPETVAKMEQLVTVLNRYQAPRRLFVCNLAPLQVRIRDACAERFRTVLYRRMMLRIATQVACRQRHAALLTGDSIGQVASQTIVNLDTINAATWMLVLRPLLGMDKSEIIALARRFGTYELSCLPGVDSCTVFMPSSPATGARRQFVEREESRIDWQPLVEEIAERTWAEAQGRATREEA